MTVRIIEVLGLTMQMITLSAIEDRSPGQNHDRDRHEV